MESQRFVVGPVGVNIFFTYETWVSWLISLGGSALNLLICSVDTDFYCPYRNSSQRNQLGWFFTP